jgi:hypothetical protein
MDYNLELAPKSTEIVSTWEDAIEYCDNLVVNGKDDWRLPTYEELLMVREQYLREVRLDVILCNAYVDGSVETPDYWTCDYDITEPDEDYEADGDEEPIDMIQTYDFLTEVHDIGFANWELHARAVRTKEPYDSISVELAPRSYIKDVTLEEAQMYCFSLNIDGKIGWRFPTPEECYLFNRMHGIYWHSDDIGDDRNETYLIHPVRDIK